MKTLFLCHETLILTNSILFRLLQLNDWSKTKTKQNLARHWTGIMVNTLPQLIFKRLPLMWSHFFSGRFCELIFIWFLHDSCNCCFACYFLWFSKVYISDVFTKLGTMISSYHTLLEGPSCCVCSARILLTSSAPKAQQNIFLSQGLIITFLSPDQSKGKRLVFLIMSLDSTWIQICVRVSTVSAYWLIIS